jgi:hypothetical protein
LDRLRTEQGKLAAAVASADNIPELVSELRKRTERIRVVETEIRVAKQTPATLGSRLATDW